MNDMTYLRRLAGITEVTDRQMEAGKLEMQLDAVKDAHAACVRACDSVKAFYEALEAIDAAFADTEPPKSAEPMLEAVNLLMTDLQPYAKGNAHKAWEKAKAGLEKALRDYQ